MTFVKNWWHNLKQTTRSLFGSVLFLWVCVLIFNWKACVVTIWLTFLAAAIVKVIGALFAMSEEHEREIASKRDRWL